MNDDIEYEVDYDRLRSDLVNYLKGAFYGGNFGAALIESFEAETCPDEQLLALAQRYGFPIQRYLVPKRGRNL